MNFLIDDTSNLVKKLSSLLLCSIALSHKMNKHVSSYHLIALVNIIFIFFSNQIVNFIFQYLIIQ